MHKIKSTAVDKSSRTRNSKRIGRKRADSTDTGAAKEGATAMKKGKVGGEEDEEEDAFEVPFEDYVRRIHE